MVLLMVLRLCREMARMGARSHTGAWADPARDLWELQTEVAKRRKAGARAESAARPVDRGATR